jgi:sodium/potassium-transporting ATPase subunit alpha
MAHSGMQIARQSPAEALAALDSASAGLSGKEATRRLEEFGPNRVEAVARTPWWLSLLGEFTHFFALILWFAAILAFTAAYLQPGEGMFELGLAILGVIVVNGSFSFWQTYRAEQALAALEKLLPQSVKVRRDGLESDIPVDQLVPGDILLLIEGAKVPADCRLLESWGLRVNLSTLTGETYPAAGPEPAARSTRWPPTACCWPARGVSGGEPRAVVYASPTGASTATRNRRCRRKSAAFHGGRDDGARRASPSFSGQAVACLSGPT